MFCDFSRRYDEKAVLSNPAKLQRLTGFTVTTPLEDTAESIVAHSHPGKVLSKESRIALRELADKPLAVEPLHHRDLHSASPGVA